MSAYDLFALHLMERETMHVDLERRRQVRERLARERAKTMDAAASVTTPVPARAATRRGGAIRRLLPGGA